MSQPEPETVEPAASGARRLFPTSVLLPIILVLLALATITIGLADRYTESASLRHLTDLAHSTQALYRALEETQAYRHHEQLGALVADDELKAAFVARDREALLTASTTILRRLAAESGTTHFYYILPDRTTFLRVHNPPRHGDRIDRLSLLEAATTGQMAWAAELGPFQTFTLRVVQPWFDGDVLIGYVELGRETRDIASLAASEHGCGLIFLISKDLIDRGSWEEGRRMLGRPATWDEFRSFVRVEDAGPGQVRLPAGVVEQLEEALRGDPEAVLLRQPGPSRGVGIVPLLDRGGSRLGYTLVLDDVEEVAGSAAASATATSLATVAMAMLLTWVSFRSLRRAGLAIEERTSALEAARDELGQANSQLARDIVEREEAQSERDALQRQLLQAQKMEAIGHLAGGVAHDFNNTLAIIRTRAQLGMTLAPPGSGAEGELRVILNACERANELTQKMLTFARKETPEARPVLLNDVVRDVQEILEKGLSKKIELSVDLGEGMSPALANPNQLVHAMLNVCNNAADAMPDGGTLAIETQEAVLDAEYCRSQVGVGPGCYCVIQVRDSGAGMTEAELGKVFDPFYTTKAVGKGTGLGLSTTLGILRDHGGHITVESEPGRGTCVRMFVPEATSSARTEAKPDDDEVPGGNETILAVDDEVDLLEGVARLLGLKGYRVLSASGGNEAIEIYRERHGEIDLLILDLVMPSPDGIEVYRAMKKIDPTLRAVLTSGFSPRERARDLRGEGIQGFVPKPYSIGALCRTVREVLDSRA